MKLLFILLLLPAVLGMPSKKGSITQAGGSFSSPNFPANYPDNYFHYWEMYAAAGKRIRLTFSPFEVEGSDSGNCEYDRVDVFTSPNVIGGRFCGNTIPPAITSTGDWMRVELHTDDSVNFPGFAGSWVVVDGDGKPEPTQAPGTTSPTPPPPGCGGHFTGWSGTITSPNYPGNYGPDMDCTYTATIPSGRIRIIVEFMDLEDSIYCGWDYLEIRDGSSGGSVLKKLCGAETSVIFGTTNSVYMAFHSDGFNQGGGFRLTYEAQ